MWHLWAHVGSDGRAILGPELRADAIAYGFAELRADAVAYVFADPRADGAPELSADERPDLSADELADGSSVARADDAADVGAVACAHDGAHAEAVARRSRRRRSPTSGPTEHPSPRRRRGRPTRATRRRGRRPRRALVPTPAPSAYPAPAPTPRPVVAPEERRRQPRPPRPRRVRRSMESRNGGYHNDGYHIATIANAAQEQCVLGPTIVRGRDDAPYYITPNLCSIGTKTYASKKTVRDASPRKVCHKFCEAASEKGKLELKHVQGLTCYCKRR